MPRRRQAPHGRGNRRLSLASPDLPWCKISAIVGDLGRYNGSTGTKVAAQAPQLPMTQQDGPEIVGWCEVAGHTLQPPIFGKVVSVIDKPLEDCGVLCRQFPPHAQRLEHWTYLVKHFDDVGTQPHLLRQQAVVPFSADPPEHAPRSTLVQLAYSASVCPLT